MSAEVVNTKQTTTTTQHLVVMERLLDAMILLRGWGSELTQEQKESNRLHELKIDGFFKTMPALVLTLFKEIFSESKNKGWEIKEPSSFKRLRSYYYVITLDGAQHTYVSIYRTVMHDVAIHFDGRLANPIIEFKDYNLSCFDLDELKTDDEKKEFLKKALLLP